MLKLISEDGDSFAKRAEMYYKRRPELINFVEESYRAYRSLAERYDHISTELQNANNALATYFPDQVQFAMDDDDDESPRSRRMPPNSQFPKPPLSSNTNNVIPNVPKAPLKDLKSILSTGAKKLRPKKETSANKKASSSTQSTSTSGLTKPQALEKIDKLQKDILGLQTVKEFVKSSYEGGLAKYWEIEDQITGLQAEVSSLQDEFNETVVIEDDEARSLMTEAALKSCQETLTNLQDKHEKSIQSAKVEQLRIKEVSNRFYALNKEFLPGNEITKTESSDGLFLLDTKGGGGGGVKEEEEDGEAAAAVALEEKIKQHYIQVESSSSSPSSSLTVAEMTEKIDELVNKVISLETAVSSQDALIARLKNDTDDLQSEINILEKDRAALAKLGSLDEEKNVRRRMEDMKHKLHGVENLSVDVKKQNVNLHTHFTEAKCNLQHLYQVHCTVISNDDLKEEKVTSTRGDVLPKKMELVDEVEKDNSSVSEKPPTEKKDLDGNNKEITEREQNSICSSSSLRKPCTESGGGRLLSGAKKLMGFKVVQEEASSPSISVISSNDSGMQKNDNMKEKDHEEEVSHVVSSSQPSAKVNQQPAPTARIESAGLLTEAKKLMGFKVVQEDSATPDSQKTSSELLSSSAVVDEKQKTLALSSAHNNPQAKLIGVERIVTEPLGSETHSSLEEQKKKNAPTEATADTAQSNHPQMTSSPPLQDHDIIADVKNSVPHEIEVQKQHQQNNEMVKQRKAKEEDEEPNRRDLCSESKEKTFLSEHTMNLRNYKDMKRKLSEEKKTSEVQMDAGQTTDTCIDQQLRELKTANALKDEEIRALREKLNHLQTVVGQQKEPKMIVVKESFRVPSSRKAADQMDDDDDDDDMKAAGMMMMSEEPASEIEEKLRMDIDQVLEVNLDFWLRFSEALNQIQKYESVVEDLRREISKLEEKANKQEGITKKQEGSSHPSRTLNLKSDLKPIYKHLSEIQTELTVWMDKCVLLKDEQQSRFTSLCDIQEEITKAVKTSAEDEDFRFTSYQAAKFQGEVLNMKQENNKVANELQAGLDHITVLQIDVDRTLVRLNEEYEFSGPPNSHQDGSKLTHSPSRARVPLRSFIFGVKQKKRPSIFTCMTPAMHRKYNGLRVGF